MNDEDNPAEKWVSKERLQEVDMPRFSANLTMLFTEVDFMDRFERSAKAGFKAVEYMFPYPFDAQKLADALKRNNLKQVLFNLPAGNWDAGERGIAVIPARKLEFEEGVAKAIRYAKALDCSLINCLVGLKPSGVSESLVRDVLASNLRFAAEALAQEGIRLLIESLNTRDIPRFYLSRSTDVLSLIREINHPNIYYQYDIYHMQVMEGDITTTISNNIKIIAHMQVADNPGRHEPGTGEINFPNLFRFIDEASYAGFIGCEYKPLTTTEEGLGWIKPYLQ
jgi:hydroxypyruvate isomerase